MPKCGNCGKADATVAEIRECYGVPQSTASYTNPVSDVATVNPFAKPKVEITEGLWHLDGEIYKVQRAVHGSGQLYAKLASHLGGFDYAPGALRTLREQGAQPLDREAAARFGKLYGMCCICGRTLTDESSIEAGIGPICAGKRGWA